MSAFPMVLYRYQVGALVIAFISFMYPQSNMYGFALSIEWIDLFFIVTIASYFFKQGYKSYTHHPLITVILILYTWSTITTFMAINYDYSYDSWEKFSKVLVIALLVYAMLGTEKRMVALLKVMVLSYGFYGIKGGLFTIASGGTAHVLGPLSSFFHGNNEMALVLVMTAPFMYFFYSHAENIYQRYFALFCAVLSAIAVLGTQSRTGFVALIVCLLYFTWLQKKLFRAIQILVPIACVAYFFMPDSWTERMATTNELQTDSSFQGRVDMWYASLRIVNDNPVTGGGFDVIFVPEVISRYVPIGVDARAIHSAYFQALAEHGYVGFVLFLIMLFYTYNIARRMARQSKNVDNGAWFYDYSIALRSSIMAYLVIGLTTNIAFFDLLYFLMIATAIADNTLQRKLKPVEYHPHLRVVAPA
tara:strand:- start:174069 stop:175322 length:1254 start_codon:yes stop_codon:yes gene_type:complete